MYEQKCSGVGVGGGTQRNLLHQEGHYQARISAWLAVEGCGTEVHVISTDL